MSGAGAGSATGETAALQRDARDAKDASGAEAQRCCATSPPRNQAEIAGLLLRQWATAVDRVGGLEG